MPERPSTECLLDLHRRLLAIDPVAPAELTQVAVDALAEELRQGSRRIRDDCVALDAATDAILEFAKQPRAFDPARLDPWAYLKMAARGNAANILKKEWRHRDRVFRFAEVELRGSAGNKEIARPPDEVADQEIARARLDALASGPINAMPAEDIAVLRLIAAGERATGPYATILGLADRPEHEQRRCVKQAKDRVIKRLKRSVPEELNG